MSLIQALYWFAFIALLLFSWSRSRGILHPHFMFCTMLFILASDFMIRGMDDANLQGIMQGNLTVYQLATLATMIGLGLSTAMVRRPYEQGTRITQPEMRVSVNTARGLMLGAVAIFLIHSAFRLNAVEWSLQTLIEQMLGPRDTRLWDQASADGTRSAVYQLLNGLYPLGAIAFGFVVFSRHAGLAVIAAVFFTLSLFVLVTDGSRTQAIIPMASLAIFGLMSLRSFVAKVVLVSGVVALILIATSAMILFRSSGLDGSNSTFALTYHQDDNLYRLWSACAYADFSNYRWDPLYFFYYVISNPVPRGLWAGKPLLDENFFGGFKLWWVTMSFMGEWVSMFGTWMGFIVSFLFGNLLYRGFYYAQRLLTMPLGLTAYLVIALYVYMVIRSMQNLTIFIYAPVAALILVYFATRRKNRMSSVAGTGASPAWSS